MFNQVGGLNAIGAPLPPNQIGGESFIRHIGNDKLIFDFHEGSGTTVYDKSHCGNDGIFKGEGEPAWLRNEVSFDGSDDKITVAHSASVNFAGNYTLELCINVTTHGDCGLLYKYNGGEAYRFYWGVSEDLSFRGAGAGGDITVTGLVIAVWYHVVAVFNGTHNIMYVDAKYEGDAEAGPATPNAADILIATNIWNEMFDGHINGFRLYNRALSQVEIQQNYLVHKFGNN